MHHIHISSNITPNVLRINILINLFTYSCIVLYHEPWKLNISLRVCDLPRILLLRSIIWKVCSASSMVDDNVYVFVWILSVKILAWWKSKLAAKRNGWILYNILSVNLIAVTLPWSAWIKSWSPKLNRKWCVSHDTGYDVWWMIPAVVKNAVLSDSSGCQKWYFHYSDTDRWSEYRYNTC